MSNLNPKILYKDCDGSADLWMRTWNKELLWQLVCFYPERVNEVLRTDIPAVPPGHDWTRWVAVDPDYTCEHAFEDL
mgnify:CR=1 FL=1